MGIKSFLLLMLRDLSGNNLLWCLKGFLLVDYQGVWCYKKDVMANKRVADILARTYFSNGGEGNSVQRSADVAVEGRYFNLNVWLLLANVALVLLLIVGWKTGLLFNPGTGKAPNVTSEELRINPSSAPSIVAFDFSKPGAGATLEYYINLDGVDASKFSAIAFDVRFSEGENHSIRVEFVNKYKEVGEVGIPSLGSKWKEVIIPLSEVTKISSWNDVRQIGFVLDKWNVSVPKGTLYIDNIRFVEGTS